ncbi:hypothetical protein ACN9MB_13690 [Dyella kyungheensis]|uniref:hypothetical protein n=1 Tax=Dyella kyungheensis TaxID=1242174 RepID=UPI003CF6487E
MSLAMYAAKVKSLRNQCPWRVMDVNGTGRRLTSALHSWNVERLGASLLERHHQ